MNGAYVYTPAIWPPLIGVLVLTVLGTYSWRRRRDVPAAAPLAVGWLFRVFWLLGIAFEAAAVDPGTKIFWFKFQAIWQLPAVTAGLCFVLEYAFPGRWLTRRNLLLLSIPVFFDIVLNLFGGPQLGWRELYVGPDGRVVGTTAPTGIVTAAYGLGLLLVNVSVLAWLFIRSPQHRWPVAIILVAQIATRALYVVDTAHLPLAGSLDPGVLGAIIGATAYAIALFGFRIFDPLPAARRTVIEQMQAGTVVFDPRWRVVSLNPAAERILGVRVGAARGKTWQQLAPQAPIPELPDASQQLAAARPELPDMTFGGGSNVRCYEPALSPLKDARGLLMGYLLMLRDVTEQQRAQAQIIEQQRSLAVLDERERLARELHDELGQVLGYVKMQAQATRNELAREQVETADEYLSQLVTVAQDAHDDVREYILATKTTAGSQVEFIPALQAYLQQFEAHYRIRTELLLGPGLTSGDFEPMVQVQLQRIIQEALTNARKHGHARCVQVRFQREDCRALVAVEDDGIGFDPELLATSEGGHFGLQFLQERAQEVGGRVIVVSSPGRGTRVEIEVPVRQKAGEGAPGV